MTKEQAGSFIGAFGCSSWSGLTGQGGEEAVIGNAETFQELLFSKRVRSRVKGGVFILDGCVSLCLMEVTRVCIL